MAAPAVAAVAKKILVKLAVDAATDAEKRKRIMMLILMPVIGLLLLIAFIVFILTSPLSWFFDWLLPDELQIIEDFQIDYGFNQNIGIYENDYIEGSGIDYEGIIFSDGATDVVYYSQLDSRWRNVPYGRTGTIGTSGCGPTAMAIVVSSLTNRTVDPVTMSNWAVQNGYRAEGNGSFHSLIPGAARHWGLNVESDVRDNPQRIVDALTEGKLVVAIMARGHFTSRGHYIVLRGVTSSGKILVADPASKSRSEQEWDLSIILNEARRGAGAGGPFWIIG